MQDFNAFFDTGGGMSIQSQQHWAKFGTKPQKDAGALSCTCLFYRSLLLKLNPFTLNASNMPVKLVVNVWSLFNMLLM